MSGKVKVWGNPVTVEWADPVEEPDPEIMAKVRVISYRLLCTCRYVVKSIWKLLSKTLCCRKFALVKG